MAVRAAGGRVEGWARPDGSTGAVCCCSWWFGFVGVDGALRLERCSTLSHSSGLQVMISEF